MSKNLCISSMVLTLLSATLAGANEATEESKSSTASARVEVKVESADGPVKTGQVRVETKDGSGQKVQVWNIAPGSGDYSKVFRLSTTPVKLGDYWLGLECYPARGALRAQLGLPDDQGLVVEKVSPESPAAKAGIERYDVLVKAGKRPLKGVQDLVDAVESAKETELAIALIRGGKRKEIEVTPAKRPDDAHPENRLAGLRKADWDRMRKLLDRMPPGDLPKGPFRFRFYHPGGVLPPDAGVDKPLPGNTTINITKQGDKPAKIVVQRDDEKWQLTEEDLDKLPDDLRPHVERMLGRTGATNLLAPGTGAAGRRHFDFIPDWAEPWRQRKQIEEDPDSKPTDSPKDRIDNRLKKQMDEMNRRIEELRKSLDELRKERP